MVPTISAELCGVLACSLFDGQKSDVIALLCRVRQFCLSMARPHDFGEDAFQDTCLTLWQLSESRVHHQAKNISNFIGYAFGIAKHHLSAYGRERSRTVHTEDVFCDGEIMAGTRKPLDDIIQKEKRTILRSYIANLPTDQKSLLIAMLEKPELVFTKDGNVKASKAAKEALGWKSRKAQRIMQQIRASHPPDGITT